MSEDGELSWTDTPALEKFATALFGDFYSMMRMLIGEEPDLDF